MAHDSNVSPKTLESIPEEDAAKYSLPEKHPKDMSLKRVQDDAVIVYAAVDIEKALEVASFMRSLKMTGESPRISLYDMQKFGGSLIEKPEKLLDRCRIIFILLTVNFEHDKHCMFVLHETLADTRLERGSSDPQKYCVRPLHTQPEHCRDYKTPCGLKSICAFDVHDLHNGKAGQRLLDLFNFERGYRETEHCHEQPQGQSKFCKEIMSDWGLAETSLVNDYATMGPSSSSPLTRPMTNGCKPSQSKLDPHKVIRRQGNETTLRGKDDNDGSEGSCSMEARCGSASMKEEEYSCTNEPSESPTGNEQYQSNQCFDFSDSIGSLSMDGKRSGFENSICPTIPENMKNFLDTGYPINEAVDDPDQTQVKKGGPSGEEPDHNETNTDKCDNQPKKGAGLVPAESLVCSPSREPGGHVTGASNALEPDREVTERSLPVDSEDISSEKTSVSTNATSMAREAPQSTFSEKQEPKVQRCSHLGSASQFQKAEPSYNLASNKDGQVLSTLVDTSDITKGTDWKSEVKEISKGFPGDTYSAHISDKQGDTITEPVMKTCGPGHVRAPLCSSPSSEDRSLFEPQSTKGDSPKTSVQKEESGKQTSGLPHADDVPVLPNQLVPPAQTGGTPSSATYVFINDCSHIELSGDVHLVNVNTKTEGSNVGRENHQPKTKKKHGRLALMPRNHETSSGSTGISTSSPSSTLEKGTTEMLQKTQAASDCKVTPQSGLGTSKQDVQEGSRCESDVIEEASGLSVEKNNNKISDSCLAQNGCEVDAENSNLSKDEGKKRSKRKTICFPFLRRRNKKK